MKICLRRSLVAIFSFFLLTGCSREPKLNDFTFYGLGTVLKVVYVGEKDAELEEKIKSDAALVESELSYYKKESFLSLLNSEAHKREIEVPAHVCKLIEESLLLGEKSGGLFDITYKSEGELWEQNDGSLPNAEILKEKRALVGKDKVLVDCRNNKIKFAAKGVKIDLGGIAKGYAADRAGEILKKRGTANFIVNYGGDMLICGKKGDKKWSVGIKDPDDNSQFLKTLEIDSENCSGIATSGDYERFFEINGKKYSHIIDPRSGTPVEDAKSATVIAENATIADAAATAVSVGIKEPESIKKIMEKFNVKIYTLTRRDALWVEWR